MVKRIAFTAAGIALSLAIAIGGWVITSRLMDIESNRLLSATMTFSVDTPFIEYDNDSNYPVRLTDQEIVSIVSNWEALRHREPTVRRRLHEPAAGQINMEQAVIAARMGVDFLREHGILPEEMLSFNDIRAYLGQNITYEGEFLPLEYSYWNVYFFNDYMEVLMSINAVTGQVWHIEINTYNTTNSGYISQLFLTASSDTIMDVLTAFVYELEIYSDEDVIFSFDFIEGSIEFRPTTWDMRNSDTSLFEIEQQRRQQLWRSRDVIVARKVFADSSAAAVITTTGVFVQSDNESELTVVDASIIEATVLEANVMPEGTLYFNRLGISIVPWMQWPSYVYVRD
ncbi:MAG: hypothetical protein FWC92_07380 [Defluviitaleaceae bacterium]|nr:hypothetical protein [Defluviitaleaceae bacterium]